MTRLTRARVTGPIGPVGPVDLPAEGFGDRMDVLPVGPVPVNPTDEGATAVRDAYGANYARLAALKTEPDPKSLFRLNENIAPAA